MEEKRISSRKVRVGKVVSDKMDKTVVVAIADRVAHPLYKKIVGRTYKLKAHDENNTCGIGDTVKVMETPPPVQGQALARGRDRREGQVREVAENDSARVLSESCR